MRDNLEIWPSVLGYLVDGQGNQKGPVARLYNVAMSHVMEKLGKCLGSIKVDQMRLKNMLAGKAISAQLSSVNLPSPLAVVCNDAGASNLIISWLRQCPNRDVRACVSGPAVNIWKSAFDKTRILSLDEAMNGATGLISGTSYDCQQEHKARCLAKKMGIHSIGVVDHWVNYSRRFLYMGKRILPNEIWVVDKEALKLAKASFKSAQIELKPNPYLDDIVSEIRSIDCVRKKNPRAILYLLEPMRAVWSSDECPGEFQALDYFIDSIIEIGLGVDPEIRLRPHPSDKPGKYDKWIAQHNDKNITLDPSEDLASAIAWAQTVVGCETYGMVIALRANRTVVSSLPPIAHKCRLPHDKIIHLRDLAAH